MKQKSSTSSHTNTLDCLPMARELWRTPFRSRTLSPFWKFSLDNPVFDNFASSLSPISPMTRWAFSASFATWRSRKVSKISIMSGSGRIWFSEKRWDRCSSTLDGSTAVKTFGCSENGMVHSRLRVASLYTKIDCAAPVKIISLWHFYSENFF